MDKNEIARMARQAGMLVPGHRTDIEELERFAALVAAKAMEGCYEEMLVQVAAEREACAKVCMNLESGADIPDGGPQAWWEIGCVDCADAIRTRGNQ